jgi:SAM-dependent methyltransferase
VISALADALALSGRSRLTALLGDAPAAAIAVATRNADYVVCCGAPQAQPGQRLERIDEEPLTYQPPANCDLVISWQLTEHLFDAERDALLRRLERSLLSGGFLLLVDRLARAERGAPLDTPPLRTPAQSLAFFEQHRRQWEVVTTLLRPDPEPSLLLLRLYGA